MKAAEVVRLYKEGRRDFKGVSLRGQNFKGKDLSGADFSGADIRSTNFTNANLTGANFTQAKAGLQRRWAVGLVVVSLLLSVTAGLISVVFGFLVAFIADSDSLDNQIMGWIMLVAAVVFAFLLLRKGAKALVGTLAGILALLGATLMVGLMSTVGYFIFALTGVEAGAEVLANTLSIAFAGGFAIALALVFVFAVDVAIAFSAAIASSIVGAGTLPGIVACSLVGALIGALTTIATGALPISSFVEKSIVITLAFTAAMTLVSTYVGWRAVKGDERDVWIRSVTTAFTATGGTSFRGATLTNADFSQACLKSTDFRRSILRRTCWQNAEKLDRVRPGKTYLNNPKVRELVRTGNGQGQSYDHLLNLEGINLQGANLVKADFTGSNLSYGALQGANLANASFVGANLNCAYLQDADLSDAKLVQTQLDVADLTGSTLTGAYIEDWGITTRTKLNGTRCDYIFMRLISERNPDPNPHRKPDDWNKTFADGEFVDFIAPMVETLDLYHNQAVDPRAVAIAYHDLQQQNPNAELEIVSMEKRGKNRDKLLLRAETSPQVDLSELNSQYFERYDYLLTLPTEALQALLIEKDKQVKMLARMVDTAIDRPSQDFRGAQFGGGFAGKVEGDQVGGAINNQTSEMPSLAEATAEIQNLLKALEASNPTANEADQTAFLNIMIPPIKRERFISALKAAGVASIEEVPYGVVLKALVEEW